MTSKHLVAAGVECYINSNVYGIVSSFSYLSETPRKPVFSLDRSNPHEQAPTISEIKGSMSIYREKGDGGLEGSGLLAPINTISREKYFSITLIDTSSGKEVIFFADECSVEKQSWQYIAKQRVVGTFNFSGIMWNNESQFGTLWDDVLPADLNS